MWAIIPGKDPRLIITYLTELVIQVHPGKNDDQTFLRNIDYLVDLVESGFSVLHQQISLRLHSEMIVHEKVFKRETCQYLFYSS
jgi:hypothetical protein